MKKTVSFALRLTAWLIISVLTVFSVGYFESAKDAEALSRLGSQGEEVRLIQKKLIEKGYLCEGDADGIFGTKTLNAVKRYQKDNGLVADGIAGKKTLASLGIKESEKNNPNRDKNLELLARVISAEARGEPYEGQVAVGAVVLNRVKHPSFPNTVAGVIYQKGAFDTVADGQINLEPTDSAYRAAQDAMAGADPTGGCIYFYDPRYTSNKYMLSLAISYRVGNHVFSKGNN
ncbi:MAG: cell wall hydrolase [Clostridia bacterium]|nr:cell wall hydrolase [Clostridia bacterium]